MNAAGPRTRHLVVGSGSIGRRHLRNLRTLYPQGLLGCASASGRDLDASALGIDAGFSEIEQAVAWRPDWVVVASPAPWHVQHALAFLEAGIPVLIEKPLAASVSSLGASLARLNEHAQWIAVAYPLRHLEAARLVKGLIEDSRIGQLIHVQAEVGQHLAGWRPGTDYRDGVSAQAALGGGALLELSHEFDYLRWMLGEFTEAQGMLRTSGLLDLDVEDCVDAQLRRADGLTVQVHLDFLQRPARRVCRFTGSDGILNWDLIANRVEILKPEGTPERLWDDASLDRNAIYIALLRNFERVVRGDEAPSVSLSDGLGTLRLVDAIRQSHREARRISIGTAS